MGRYARFGARLAVFGLIVSGALASWLLVRDGAIDPTAIRDAIAGNRLSAAAFVLLQILASLTFVPRTILGIAAGLMFGFGWGAFWAIFGAEAGAAAGFALWRWIGKGWDRPMPARLSQLAQRAEQGGWRAVAIARLIPGLPHSLVNAALALTSVGWGDYLLGSLVGMLPMTLLQVDIGAAGGRMLQGQGAWIAGSLLLALGLAGTFLVKRVAARRL